VSEQIEIRLLRDSAEAQRCARFMAASEPWTTLGMTYDRLLKPLTDETKEVYVAVDGAKIDGGEIAGFIVIDMRGSFVGYIKLIGVLPAWQGRGIGRQLMAFAEARIFRESPNAFICVSSFNEGAQRLYGRLGYGIVGGLTDYIVAGYDEILMWKSIAPISLYRKALK